MAPGILNEQPQHTSFTNTASHSSKHVFPTDADSLAYAQSLDEQDPLRSFRSKFIIPTKASLKAQSYPTPAPTAEDEEAVYLCGNSLGLQPKRTAEYLAAYLSTWSSLAVTGHFKALRQSPIIEPWQSLADAAARQTLPLVGAVEGEVAIANTLTVNLHLLMASFYRPSGKKTKVLLEGRAFPSDHVSFLELTNIPWRDCGVIAIVRWNRRSL
jgi:kynureninase